MDSVQTMIDQHERTSSLPFSCLGMCVCLREWDGRQSELSLCLNEDFLSFSLWGVFPEKGLPSPGGRTSCYRELPGTNTHARVLASPPPSLTSGQCIYFWSWTAKSIWKSEILVNFQIKAKKSHARNYIHFLPKDALKLDVQDRHSKRNKPKQDFTSLYWADCVARVRVCL